MMVRVGPLIYIYVAVLALLVLMDHYPVLGYALDHVALLAVIYVGLRWNEAIGILFGLATGLTISFLVGGSINFSLVFFMAVGWLTGLAPQYLNTSSLFTQILLVVVFIFAAHYIIPLLAIGSGPTIGIARLMVSLFVSLILAVTLFRRGDRRFSPPRSTLAAELAIDHTKAGEETA